MCTIDVAEFYKLIQSTEWVRTQEVEECGSDEGEGGPRWGHLLVTSTLGGIRVVWNSAYEYEPDDQGSLEFIHLPSVDREYELEGVSLVGGEGEPILLYPDFEINHFEIPGHFSDVDLELLFQEDADMRKPKS